jgi:hypothetical protein
MESLPPERKTVMEKLRAVILDNLGPEFAEQMSSGMINYVIPLSVYPAGYHVRNGEPLPFLAIASQKHHIAFYHMGLYGDVALREWFEQEYQSRMPTKLDMDKSCIRFRNLSTIPYDLMGLLAGKMTAAEYIAQYEAGALKRKSRNK